MDLNRLKQLAGITHTRSGLNHESDEDGAVGRTIAQQMGGPGKLRLMLGAKQIVLLPNGLKIQWPNKERSKGNVCVVTLRPDDTYDMEFFNGMKSVKKYEGIYNDALVSTFERHTGWFLSLGGKKSGSSTESLETKLDELRSLLGEQPKKPKPSVCPACSHAAYVTQNPDKKCPKHTVKKEGDSEWGETEGCECEEDDDECECAEEAREFSQDQLDVIEGTVPTKANAKWVMLGRDKGDRKPYEIGRYGADKSEDDLVKGWEQGQGHKLKKVGEGTYKVITKSGTIGSMLYILPVKDLPQSEAEETAQDRLDELLQSVRDIVEGQTYAKAQADIMAGLEKDGWKVKKTGPDGKPMKVPHATSPNGDFKLFFKAQAIYKTHGKGDLGNARSLHLPDIRQSSYADFGAALSRWTGQDTKGNPLPKKGSVAVEPGDWDKAVAQVKSDPNHQKHGECPNGYHFDASSKRCVKAKTEEHKCEKCGGHLGAQNPGSVCDTCKTLPKRGRRKTEDLSEALRLSGINRYTDRALPAGVPVPLSMTAMVSEIRKYATGSLHPDWVVADEGAESLEDGKGFQCMECGKKFKSVKAAENAQRNGCPKCGGSDIDLEEAQA
jgi:hypothetical protein